MMRSALQVPNPTATCVRAYDPQIPRPVSPILGRTPTGRATCPRPASGRPLPGPARVGYTRPRAVPFGFQFPSARPGSNQMKEQT